MHIRVSPKKVGTFVQLYLFHERLLLSHLTKVLSKRSERYKSIYEVVYQSRDLLFFKFLVLDIDYLIELRLNFTVIVDFVIKDEGQLHYSVFSY